MDLLKRFEESLKGSGLIRPGEKVFVACSGGPDSVALFRLLFELCEKWKLKLGLLHLNHGLRGRPADLDERFVKALARTQHIPVYTGRRKVLKEARARGWSVEEAAREVRYDFFSGIARRRRIPKIALAHTLDDQAETVLMRVLQGTGLRGLEGIRSQIRKGGLTFVRPLLPFAKKEILSYLRENRFPFRVDKSNRSPRFLRNRIRHGILPRLAAEVNPNVVRALARIPAIVREDNEMLAGLEEAAFCKSLQAVRKGKVFLRRGVFLKLPAPLQFRVLGRCLKRLDARSGVDFETWQKLKPGLRRGVYRYSLPRDIDLWLTPSRLVLFKKGKRSARESKIAIPNSP